MRLISMNSAKDRHMIDIKFFRGRTNKRITLFFNDLYIIEKLLFNKTYKELLDFRHFKNILIEIKRNEIYQIIINLSKCLFNYRSLNKIKQITNRNDSKFKNLNIFIFSRYYYSESFHLRNI